MLKYILVLIIIILIYLFVSDNVLILIIASVVSYNWLPEQISGGGKHIILVCVKDENKPKLENIYTTMFGSNREGNYIMIADYEIIECSLENIYKYRGAEYIIIDTEYLDSINIFKLYDIMTRKIIMAGELNEVKFSKMFNLYRQGTVNYIIKRMDMSKYKEIVKYQLREQCPIEITIETINDFVDHAYKLSNSNGKLHYEITQKVYGKNDRGSENLLESYQNLETTYWPIKWTTIGIAVLTHLYQIQMANLVQQIYSIISAKPSSPEKITHAANSMVRILNIISTEIPYQIRRQKLENVKKLYGLFTTCYNKFHNTINNLYEPNADFKTIMKNNDWSIGLFGGLTYKKEKEILKEIENL